MLSLQNITSIPEIHDPLKNLGFNLVSSSMTSCSDNRSPLILGPVSGGVTITTAKATRPMTEAITSKAMAMPFQFL